MVSCLWPSTQISADKFWRISENCAACIFCVERHLLRRIFWDTTEPAWPPPAIRQALNSRHDVNKCLQPVLVQGILPKQAEQQIIDFEYSTRYKARPVRGYWQLGVLGACFEDRSASRSVSVRLGPSSVAQQPANEGLTNTYIQIPNPTLKH